MMSEAVDQRQIQITQEDIQRVINSGGWRLTPASFAYVFSGGLWTPAKHLTYISSKIASKLHKGGARLIVTMPARHGKSELLSVYTPLWQLDRRPDSRVILSAYGAELATDFGRRVRDAINNDHSEDGQHLLRCRLRDDSQQVGRFQTTAGGAMYSVGVGGAITGRGADLLLIDDYLKNSKDAESQQVREDIYNWLVSTALTRLEPGGSAIILATRWNVDDLIGRLELMHGGEWEIIRLPALADQEDGQDPIGRSYGEALWPERYDREYLLGMQRQQGTFWFQAQYQQKPLPSMSGLVEAHWFKQTNVLPHPNRMELARFWDFASSENSGDYTVGVLMGRDLDTDQAYVLDVQRGQWSSATVEQKVRECAERDNADMIGLEEEPGSAGKAQISHYQRRVIPGYPIKSVKPSGKKQARAQALLAAAEAGNFKLLKANWNREFIEEFMMFPDSDHDDQVDAASHAFNLLFGKRYQGVVWGRNDEQQNPAQRQRTGTGNVVTGIAWGR